MLKMLLTILAGSTILPVYAQFYYQDILTNRTNHQHFLTLKKEKVNRVVARSLEGNGEQTEGFLMEQQINPAYSQVRTVSQTPGQTRSVMVNYYNPQGFLYRTVDSNGTSVTTYEYKYDGSGKIAQVVNSSRSTEEKVRSNETHAWLYNGKGLPEKMLRIRDGGDTTEIRFVADEKGNITEEQPFRKNVPGEKIYYYYNERGQLSDIVRFQEKLGRLIPDYTFDYDSDGRVAEMMVVQQSGRDYLVWRYQYNSQGLKTKESCYTRQKRLAGSIEYGYEMKK